MIKILPLDMCSPGCFVSEIFMCHNTNANASSFSESSSAIETNRLAAALRDRALQSVAPKLTPQIN